MQNVQQANSGRCLTTVMLRARIVQLQHPLRQGRVGALVTWDTLRGQRMKRHWRLQQWDSPARNARQESGGKRNPQRIPGLKSPTVKPAQLESFPPIQRPNARIASRALTLPSLEQALALIVGVLQTLTRLEAKKQANANARKDFSPETERKRFGSSWEMGQLRQSGRR